LFFFLKKHSFFFLKSCKVKENPKILFYLFFLKESPFCQFFFRKKKNPIEYKSLVSYFPPLFLMKKRIIARNFGKKLLKIKALFRSSFSNIPKLSFVDELLNR